MTLTARKDAINLREELSRAKRSPESREEEFYFTGDAAETAFKLPAGWKPKRVYLDGLKLRKGDAEDFSLSYDGFIHSVVFAVAPADQAEIDVEAVLA